MSREPSEGCQQSQQLEDGDQYMSAAAGGPFIPSKSLAPVVSRPSENARIKGLNGLPSDIVESQFCRFLDKPGFLHDSDIFALSSVSKTTQALFQPNQLQMLANKLLLQVIRGKQEKAEVILKIRPALLLVKGTATDYSGRTIIATAFQAALGAGDKPMWDMMLPHLETREALRQFREWFPNGIETTPAADLQAIYNKIARAIIYGEADHQRLAIEEFRGIFTCPKEITQGHHFNLQHLLVAYQAYIDNFDALRALDNWDRLDLFWTQVVGFVQRQMPAYDAQIHCSGVQSVLDDSSKFKRLLKLDCGTDFFGKAINSGLGFDFGVFSYFAQSGSVCAGVYRPLVARGLQGLGPAGTPDLGLKKYVEQKQMRLHDLESHLSKECVINPSNDS
jgi:hypothetical protein